MGGFLDFLQTLQPILIPAGAAAASGLVTYLFTRMNWQERVDAERRKLEEFKQSVTYWSFQDIDVLIDGLKEAGKSALAARWADPTLDISRLQPSSGVSSIGVLLCTEWFVDARGTKREYRHRLVFHDAPGEHVELMSELLNRHPVRFLLFVVDPTRLEKSLERLNPMYLRSVYCGNHLDHVVGCLVYVSKRDIATDEQVTAALNRVNSDILPNLNNRYPKPFVFAGSAKTGEQLINALGHIAEQSGIAEHFAKHQSAE